VFGARIPEIVEAVDYARSFQLAPVGLAIGRARRIVDCNQAFVEMFRGSHETLAGQTFAQLYPDDRHYVTTGERVGRALEAAAIFANDRVMRRLDGELFWVHVRGRTMQRDAPHEDTLWVFSELSGVLGVRNAPKTALTPRERDVAALFV
jgi:PAS domain S-box-containing protein